MKILAIETSCDETACAVIEKTNGDIKILSNVVASQINIHKKYGGVFPEIASRAHTEQIMPVIQESLENSKSEYRNYEAPQKLQSNLKQILNNKSQMFKTLEFKKLDIVSDLGFSASNLLSDIDLISVTTGPGLIGSLLVGVNTAKTLAYANNKPIIGINHWLGHIYSCFPTIEQSNNGAIPQFPLLALIVSGGHTGLVLMKSHTEIETIGETLDDAAGEAFDKVAKLLQLGYPGGPAIADAAAKIQNPKFQIQNKFKTQNINFPRSMMDRPDFNFSFSGLKTAVLYKVKELTISHKLSAISSAVAAEFQQTVIDILIGKTLQAAEKFHPKSICLCGGVSANKELRSQMAQAIKQFSNPTISFFIPPMPLTTDNAAMIGLAAAYQDKSKWTSFDKINTNANLKL